MRYIASVSKTDAAEGWLLRVPLSSLDGELEEALEFAEKAEKLHHPKSLALKLNVLSNLGCETRTLAMLREKVVAGMPDLAWYFGSALASGAGAAVSQLVDSVADSAQISARANPLIALARRLRDVVQELSFSDDDVARVLDVCGEVIRNHFLLWVHRPRVRLDDLDSESTAPGVHFQFCVDATPSEAARLTSEISWQLVTRDLAHPYISASLLGVKLAEADRGVLRRLRDSGVRTRGHRNPGAEAADLKQQGRRTVRQKRLRL